MNYLLEREKGCFYYEKNADLKIINKEILDTLISKLERRINIGRMYP